MVDLSSFVDLGSDKRTIDFIYKSLPEDLKKSFRDRTKLVPKVIVDKNGHRRTVLVRPGENVPVHSPHILVKPEKNKSNYSKPGSSGVEVREITNPKEFNKIFNEARQSCGEEERWRVAKHSESDYINHNCKMYATKDGSTFAITSKGDIISVCVNQNSKTDRGKDLMETAKNLGGKSLDCYDHLVGFYIKCGFTPVSRCDGDESILEQYVDDWKKQYGVEDVVFFALDDKPFKVDTNDFKNIYKHVKDKVSRFSDYDEAEQHRNNFISGGKYNEQTA